MPGPSRPGRGQASPRGQLASASARYIASACLLAIFFAFGASGSTVSLTLGLGGGILLLTFDFRNPVSLRNFFVVYTLALFAVGVPLFHLPPSLLADMLLYVAVFLFGYALSSLRRNGDAGSDSRTRAGLVRPTTDQMHAVELLMLAFAFLQLLLLAFNVSRYGIGGFYGGQSLLDQFSTYGKASASGGVIQIVTFFLKFSTIAVVVIYVQVCLEARRNPHYRYLVLVLVGIPILSLSRSDALHGAGLLLIINVVARRIASQLEDEPADETSTPTSAPDRRPARGRTLAIAATMVIALAAAFVIGGLRQSRLSPNHSFSALGRSLPLLQSEFTPIQAYGEIKQNDELLGRRHGTTIVLPIIFKIVPRALYPGKPINSGAYFMSVLHPAEFAANFALPPTLFGDAYMNFGTLGVVIACLLLGLVTARLDIACKRARLSMLPWFLIVYASFYDLLRSPLSESLAGILLTVAAWTVLRWALGLRRPSRQPSLRLARREPAWSTTSQ